MKKFITFLMICFALVAFSGCGNADVEEALEGTKWYCNVGYFYNGIDNEVLGTYEFADGKVTYAETEGGSNVFLTGPVDGTYKVTDDTIVISIDGMDDTKISYSMENGNIKFEEGYFSEQDIMDAAQGNWQHRLFEYEAFFGGVVGVEYHVAFENDKIGVEGGVALGTGEIGYLGFSESTYELGYGQFVATDPNLDEESLCDDCYFHIMDGQVILYCVGCQLEPGGEFLGEDGYKL